MHETTFSDFVVGQSFLTQGRTVTEADIVNFTGVAGITLPLFVDDEYCRKHTPYGGRITPGLLIAAFAVGMMEGVLGPHVLAALALDEFRFHRPVRPGGHPSHPGEHHEQAGHLGRRAGRAEGGRGGVQSGG